MSPHLSERKFQETPAQMLSHPHGRHGEQEPTMEAGVLQTSVPSREPSKVLR